MSKLLADVELLVLYGWNESDAIRAVAAKYDIEDYEVALYLLEVASHEG